VAEFAKLPLYWPVSPAKAKVKLDSARASDTRGERVLRDTTMRENMIRSVLTRIRYARRYLVGIGLSERDLFVRDTLSIVSCSFIVHGMAAGSR